MGPIVEVIDDTKYKEMKEMEDIIDKETLEVMS